MNYELSLNPEQGSSLPHILTIQRSASSSCKTFLHNLKLVYINYFYFVCKLCFRCKEISIFIQIFILMKVHHFATRANLLILVVLVLMIQACTVSPENPVVVAEEESITGPRRTYRKDGTLLAEVFYKDTLRHGLARNYYRNGNLQLEMTYTEGKKHGEATTYYENGGIYQVIPYVNGKSEGIGKRYYPNGALMAEIPLENDQQMQGMKEYSKNGKLLTKETHIIFRLEDKTAEDNVFELFYQLSDQSPHARFIRYFPDEDGSIKEFYHVATEKGVASEEFRVSPGRKLNSRIYIKGERLTRLGNLEVFWGSYNLAVENKQR
jgi:hypothetical protein